MFKPLNDRVLLIPEEVKNETDYGFVLPDIKEKPVIGTVVEGNELVKKGDRVLFSKFGFDEVEIDNVLHYLVSTDNLLGVF